MSYGTRVHEAEQREKFQYMHAQAPGSFLSMPDKMLCPYSLLQLCSLSSTALAPSDLFGNINL